MNHFFPNYLRVPVFFFVIFGAMEYFIDSGSQPAFVRYPITLLFLAVVLVALLAIEAVVSASESVTYRLMTDQQRQALEKAQKEADNSPGWWQKFLHKVSGKPREEEEAKLLLHHDYDGIRELDNNLPSWWLYLFYGCIVFSAVYLVHYELMGGESQEDEFNREMAEAKIAVEEYKKNAPDLMDEKTVTLLTDAAALAKGKELYDMNCAACHRGDGGGTIGPNLTDQQWILGGGINTIFATINNGGRDGKGMVAWRGTLKPQEIQSVASYIVSLQGTNPKEPKAPEGDIIWTIDQGGSASAGSSIK